MDRSERAEDHSAFPSRLRWGILAIAQAAKTSPTLRPQVVELGESRARHCDGVGSRLCRCRAQSSYGFAKYAPPSGGIDKWQVSKDKWTRVPDSDFGTYEWEGDRTDSACDDHPTHPIGHVLTNDHSAGFSKEKGDYAAAKKISDDFREATLGKFNDGELTVGEVLFDTCFRRKETWENRTFTAHYDGDAIVATCTAHDIESMSVLSAEFLYPTPDRDELIVFTLTTTPDQ